ncbi:MAG: gamma-glutamyltransferase, partial [Verrucomicrobiota bacterium]
MKIRIRVLLSTLMLVHALSFAQSGKEHIYESASIFKPVIGYDGMVSTQNFYATEAAAAVLERGGNAVDAAVTAGFVLAVTLPRAGNLGGGGFMLIHDAKSGETWALDHRETAPSAAARDMYLDPAGEVDRESVNFSYLSAGVPGTVRGMQAALERYGTLKWREVIEPAIALAREGFRVTQDLHYNLKRAKERLSKNAYTQKLYYGEDRTVPAVGTTLKLPDLAKTLQTLADGGPDAFYTGEIAATIAEDMSTNGGLISLKDLSDYRVAWRPVVEGDYRGYTIQSMPPSSSGGVHLIQMLNILEMYPIADYGHNTAQTIHLMAEAMRSAYADRSKYLGDTDFVEVPITGLTSKAYANALRSKISIDTARNSADLGPDDPYPFEESPETTHYSVVDGQGNAVSCTTTLRFSFGNGFAADGLGFLYNNNMGNFAAKPGTADAFGLIGAEANAIEPGKRMLSSMTPAIVLKDGKVHLVTGSP